MTHGTGTYSFSVSVLDNPRLPQRSERVRYLIIQGCDPECATWWATRAMSEVVARQQGMGALLSLISVPGRRRM